MRFFRTLPQIRVPTKPHIRQTLTWLFENKKQFPGLLTSLFPFKPPPSIFCFNDFCNSYRLRCWAVSTGTFLWFGTPAKIFSLNSVPTVWVFQALVRFGNAFCGFCLSASNPDKSNIKHTDTSKDLAHEECSAQFISQHCSRPKTNHTVFWGGFVNICHEKCSWKENNTLYHWGSTFVFPTENCLHVNEQTFLVVLLFQIQKSE